MSDDLNLRDFNTTYERERLQRWEQQLRDETHRIGCEWREIRAAERANASDAASNHRQEEVLREREHQVNRRSIQAELCFGIGITLIVVGLLCLVASVLVR
jgi:hypothetical protein